MELKDTSHCANCYWYQYNSDMCLKTRHGTNYADWCEHWKLDSAIVLKPIARLAIQGNHNAKKKLCK